jgi:hypothetical protein
VNARCSYDFPEQLARRPFHWKFKDVSQSVVKIETLNQAVAQLQQRVEDLEDLRDLEAAIAENAGKPLIPWEKVKAELEIE